METFKVHINSLYTSYLTDFIKDNHWQIMSTDVIEDVKAWKFNSEDLVLINVDASAMSIDKVDMNFWLGYGFVLYLTKMGVNPLHVL